MTTQQTDVEIKYQTEIYSKLDEWTTKLNEFDSCKKRAILTTLHNNFTNIIIIDKKTETKTQWLQKNIKLIVEKNNLKVKHLKDYNNTYSKSLIKKNDEKNEPKLEVDLGRIALEAVIYIYCKEGGVRFLYNEKGDFLFDEITKEIKYEIIEIPKNKVIESEHIYNFYYWKKNSEYESYEGVNVGKLKIFNNWTKAELKFKSGDIPSNLFEGNIQKVSSVDGGETVNLYLIEKSNKSLTLNLYFHLANPKKYIWATFSNENRDHVGQISVGFFYLVLDDTLDFNADFPSNIDMPDEITYFLRKKRYKIPIITNTNQKGVLYPTNKIKNIAGIYKGYLIHLDAKNLSLNSFILIIHPNGGVTICTRALNNYPDVYIGSYNIIEGNGKTLIKISYDYNDKAKKPLYDEENKNFNFILTKNFSKKDDMQGVRSGIQPDSSSPITSKVYLENITDNFKIGNKIYYDLFSENRVENINEESIEILIEDNTNEGLIRKKIKNKINDLESIPIFNEGKVSEDIIQFLKKGENQHLNDFFLGETSQNYTDGNVISTIQNIFPNKTNKIPINGNFICFSYSLQGNHKIFDYNSSKDALIIKYPIYIESNGLVKIKISTTTYIGKAFFNDDRKELLLTFNENVFMSCIFNIPTSIDGEIKTEKHSGVLIKSLRNSNNQSEGRVCLLLKTENTKSDNFEDANYEQIYYDTPYYHKMDKDTHGALSYLAGPINRIARAESNIKEFKPRTQSSFKKDLFYSACYIASKKEENYVKETKSRLFQSYIHGFGQSNFSGKSIQDDHTKDDESIKSLVSERDLINKALEDEFKEEELKEYVKSLWFEMADYKKIEKLFGVNQNKQSLILIPTFYPNTAGGAPATANNDKKTVDNITYLLTFNKLPPPKEIRSGEGFQQNDNNSIICVGLFTNWLSNAINESHAKEIKRLFKFEKGKDENKEFHKVKIASFDKGNISYDEEKWICYELENETKYIDFAIFANLAFQGRNCIICGGLRAIGTEKIGEYILKGWKKIYNDTDSDTSISIEKSESFVCLYGITKENKIEHILTRAY